MEGKKFKMFRQETNIAATVKYVAIAADFKSRASADSAATVTPGQAGPSAKKARTNESVSDIAEA
ncbi:hypothetical protein THAOC_06035, partial [Thalassiosira oceanica]